MTVIPFRSRVAGPQSTSAGPRLATTVAVTGSFRSPSGRAGTFTGCYRLERIVSRSGARSGEMAAAGVFTGELTDADGSRIGIGSRRQTAAVEFVANGPTLDVRLGPLDVNLLGFLVRVHAMDIAVHGQLDPPGRSGLRLVDAGFDPEEPLPSVTEMMRSVVSAAAARAVNTGDLTEPHLSQRPR